MAPVSAPVAPEQVSFDSLPSELLAACLSVASEMDVIELYRIASVSQSFRTVAQSHCLPQVCRFERGLRRRWCVVIYG